LGYSLAQGVVAIIICFAVLFVGMKSLALSVRGLIDSFLNKEIIDGVKKIIRQSHDVNEFHSLRLKKSGPYVFGDVEIRVNKRLSIKEAHEIADRIEKNIKQEFPEIASFLIHVEPNE
jgi:divalent metal cation (Fe/Co/Zn/Cd) transporter